MASERQPRRDTTEPNAAAAEGRGQATAAPGDTAAPTTGGFFSVDEAFLNAARTKPYERQRHDPLYRPLRIYTLDPAARRLEGALATINVSYENLKPGPIGALFEVCDWDEAQRTSYLPVDLDDRGVLINNGRDPSLSDHRFHQQMVYAVCSSTYNVFRLALGRDPSWGFKMDPGRAPVLRIRPHAKREKNAYYDA